MSANCTTDRSSPPANITWFVNGEPMRSGDFPNVYHEEHVDTGDFQLQMRTLELHFPLDRHQHFLGGRHTLELRCSARVEGLPTVPPRSTTRLVSLRESNYISHQKQVTYLAASGAAGGGVFFLSLFLCVGGVLIRPGAQLS